jgi:hypothetical protein
MAGGFKKFGPTYDSTYYVRTSIEGDINGMHNISAKLVADAMAELAPAYGLNYGQLEPQTALAGKIAGIMADGVGLATAGAKNAIGLFREDLNDMVNASMKASFYFRGGEYYVAEERLGTPINTFAIGDSLTTNATGSLIKLTDLVNERAIGTVVHTGAFPAGNMYEWAGAAGNGGQYLGFILHM